MKPNLPRPTLSRFLKPAVLTILLAFILSALPCLAALLSLSPQSGIPGSAVNVTGFSFDPTPSNNVVFFGATRATVATASLTNLTALVPAGATFAPVTVTVGGLTAQSSQRFLPTYAGRSGAIKPSNFAGQTVSTENGPFQTIIADLDGDGKPDLVVANVYAHTVSVYRNVSTNGSPSSKWLAPPFDLPLVLGSTTDNPLGIAVADLDGDGKLDILVCDRASNQLLICRNLALPGTLSANSFAAPFALPTGTDPRGLRVADLDGDGRQDIVVVNFGSSTVSLFQNIGGPGSLSANSFAPRADLPAASGVYDAVVADLDGDGQLDIATVNYNASFVSVFRNVGSIGILTTNSFAAEADFPSPGNCESIIAVDIDGDGVLDLAIGSIQGQTMSVLRNTSTPGSLAFDAHVDFAAPGWVHNVVTADFNGDGKPDLAMDGELGDFMSVFQNGSVPGAFSSASLSNRVDFSTGYNVWGISVGDLDGDGRPDIAFCNIYDNTLTLYRNLLPFVDSPNHFDWSPVASPQFPNQPFAVTVLAHDATNGLVSNFNRTVILTSTNGVPVTPTISASFTQGVWTGSIAVSQVASNLVLQADDGRGAVGFANAISVVEPPALLPVTVGNYLLLFWPIYPTGFVLQNSPSLNPLRWTDVAGSPKPVGDLFLVPVPIAGPNQFYRLRYVRP
jgi:hypothetical protein